ncbi:MAG: hypothetical protein FVQ78_07975 [Solirubrobacterales bacterium]|nr:hypothetical protein [Solirubrobacterales bacterium]
MSGWIAGSGNGRRPPFPESTPPEINHSVLTGKLRGDPQPGRSPTGDPVRLLRVEFPVADPDCGQALWTWASCLVEVPVGRVGRDVEELHGGASVLAAGQLSDRWMIENGHTSRRGVIVATLVKSGPPPVHWDLLQ